MGARVVGVQLACHLDRRCVIDGGRARLVGIDRDKGLYKVKYFAGGTEGKLKRHAFIIKTRYGSSVCVHACLWGGASRKIIKNTVTLAGLTWG